MGPLLLLMGLAVLNVLPLCYSLYLDIRIARYRDAIKKDKERRTTL